MNFVMKQALGGKTPSPCMRACTCLRWVRVPTPVAPPAAEAAKRAERHLLTEVEEPLRVEETQRSSKQLPHVAFVQIVLESEKERERLSATLHVRATSSLLCHKS